MSEYITYFDLFWIWQFNDISDKIRSLFKYIEIFDRYNTHALVF